MTEIKKLDDKFNTCFDEEARAKINELISIINEQQKQIDFIMENSFGQKRLNGYIGNSVQTLKDLYKEKCSPTQNK